LPELLPLNGLQERKCDSVLFQGTHVVASFPTANCKTFFIPINYIDGIFNDTDFGLIAAISLECPLHIVNLRHDHASVHVSEFLHFPHHVQFGVDVLFVLYYLKNASSRFGLD